MIRAQQGSLLLNQGKDLMDKCTTCDYRDTCGGGCVATRWRMDPADDHDAYCDYRMRMIDGIAALLAQPAHPAGAWCQSLRWHPRTPNSMRDVKAFLTRWDSPAATRGEVRLHTSEHGNINTVGLAGVHEADDLDPTHSMWRAAIEPGVWPLIDAITRAWGLITYDSCQGHQYAGLDLPLPACASASSPATARSTPARLRLCAGLLPPRRRTCPKASKSASAARNSPVRVRPPRPRSST